MDVDYNQGKSIAELPITSPCHAPCPDMAGMQAPSNTQREQALSHLNAIREELGLTHRPKPKPRKLHYVCTASRCLEPWEITQ